MLKLIGGTLVDGVKYSDLYIDSNEDKDTLRKLGHRPGGYFNAVEDYWPWPGRSLMQAYPYLSWLSNIKALKLVKAVAGLEKVILVSASNSRA